MTRIPPVQYETLRWMPSETGLYSRSEIRRQTGEYRSALPARIADWEPQLGTAEAADLDEAARALAGFDTYMREKLGPDMRAIAPMSAILLRTESASSSQIEQLTTTAKQLALFELGESTKDHARTVAGNVRAMEASLALDGEMSVDALLQIHRALLAHQRGMEAHVGALRTQTVWIGPGEAGPRRADFVAPRAELVPDLLADLMDFCRRVDLPALLQIAVAHAQFETIHPFVDGNGRTGRALAHVLMSRTGLVRSATVPLSAGLLTNTRGYFESLGAYRNGDAGPILEVFANAARFAAVTGRELVDGLDTELRDSRDKLAGVRADAAARRVLDVLLGQPVVNAAYLQTTLGMNPQTALRALDTLSTRGVLEERTGGRRNRVWQHTGILDVLDRYAESLTRR